jgi:hypothetical protein
MDQITDQDQPVSDPMFLACASPIQAGPRATAGKAGLVRPAALVTHHVSGPVSSRGPLGPRGGPAFPGSFSGATGNAPCASPGVVRYPGCGRADLGHGGAGG